MTPLPGGFLLSQHLVATVKTLLVLSALYVLIWDLGRGDAHDRRFLRVRNLALGALGMASLAAWANFGALHGPGRPLHLHDFFHYYTGSKYFAELGYTRLYQCVAVEEMQQGRVREVSQRWTRNLQTNDLERGTPSQAQIDECLTAFAPARWQAFSADVEWFRGHMSPPQWGEVQMVFGHNATPVWSAMGYWLTRNAPASTAQMFSLALLDPMLLAIMWVVIWRTFGWPAASIAAIWWGLNEASAFIWIGGAFLRQDCVVCIVCGVCALRTNRRVLAGILLAAAALLRAFPLFLLVALAAKILQVLHAQGFRAALTSYRGLIGGLLISATVLLTAATVTWSARGLSVLEPWKGFATNSQKHLATPITNHIGLKPALWFSSATRGKNLQQMWLDGPWDTWRAARTSTFEERRPVYILVLLLFLGCFALNVIPLPDWLIIVFGVALLPFVTTLANYYYSVLLLFGLVWPLDKPIGVGLAALTALTAVAPAILPERDDRYVMISIAVVLYAFFVVFRARRVRQVLENPPSEAAFEPLPL
jgi:hypothetical protein